MLHGISQFQLIIHICLIALSNVLTPDLKYQVRERSNKNEKCPAARPLTLAMRMRTSKLESESTS